MDRRNFIDFFEKHYISGTGMQNLMCWEGELGVGIGVREEQESN
jgi:hypothetical protein